MSLKVKAIWLHGEENPEEFKKYLFSSQKALDKLRKIVYNRCMSTEKTREVDYDCPSWSHKQAHQNGKVEAYKEILELLEFKEGT